MDFGCGQGAAVDWFNRHGFQSYGVDISSQSLSIARHRYPEIADHFAQIDPEPAPEDTFFDRQFDCIIAIQSLYYLSDSHLEDRLRSLYKSLRPGGVFYATMMSVKSGYYDQSEPIDDGLREITIDNDRLSIENYYVNFTRDENHLEDRFEPFEPVHTGFYSERFRSDEPKGHHLTYVGTKSE